jgi:two-component system, cell cycle sensor histidine kinase and response regulator CckA
MLVVDPEGRICASNPAFEQMLGYSRDELRLTSVSALTHPDDLAQTEQAITALSSGGLTSSQLDKRYVRKDGSVFWVRVAISSVRSATGEHELSISMVEDISEKMAIEAALAESEARFRRLVENVPDMIFSAKLKPEAAVEYVSPAVEALSGYTPEEFYADPDLLWRLILPEDLEKLGGMTRSTSPSSEMLRWRHKDGHIVWTELRAVPILDEQGEVVAIEGVNRDISERVQAEEALRLQGAELASIFRSTPIGIGKNVDRIIVEANPGLCRMLGYTAEELIGMPTRQLYLSDEDYEEVGRRGYSSEREESVATAECRHKRKDGRIIDVFLTLTAIDPADPTAGTTFALMDVTERKHAEEERALLAAQLLRTQKLEAVGSLAGGVAHNFNNLLAGIVGYGELALTGLPEESPVRPDVEQVLRSAQRAAEVVRGLLAFTRREPKSPEILDLNTIVSELEVLLGQLVGTGIEIETALTANPAFVRLDRSQIEQAIVNLVVNARDAMPDGGRLTIQTRRTSLSEPLVDHDLVVPPGDYVTLTVRDSGIGMDEQTLDRVFEPFFTKKGPGVTGLGLSSVFGIVEGAAGQIHLESQPGEGTLVTIHWPVAES